MAWPATLQLVTVAIRFDVPPAGGATGKVVFTVPSPLNGATDGSIVPAVSLPAYLAQDGTASIQLPATNDPQWTPQGWAYTVEAQVAGSVRTGTLQLDYQSTSVELADLIQWDGAAEAGQTYIPLTSRGVAGGVAALDIDGDVTDASGAKITGGGGGGAAPSGTVVSETAYGQSASAGNATAYSRGNHTHGTPTAPAAATISDSTATGRALITAADAAAARTTLGLGGAAVLPVGTTTGTVAAGDDSRITGAQQRSTLTTKGDLYVATASATVARLPVGSDGQVLTADSAQATGTKWATVAGGGGTAATFARAYVTSGDLTMPNDAGWTIVSGGPTLSLPASAGDDVSIWVSCLLDHNAARTDFYELVVVVGGTIVRFASTGTSSPAAAGEGDPSIYAGNDQFIGSVVRMGISVVSGDLDSGSVVWAFAHKGPGAGKIFASSNYPLRWEARNDH